VPLSDVSVEFFEIEGEMCHRVEFSGVEEKSTLEQRESNGEGLCCDFVAIIILYSFGDDSEFFGCKIGECLFEGGFFEVGAFVGPTVQICDLDLSFLVDEDVVGSYITDFTVNFVEVRGAAHQTIE
jgi:hypothetical protein